MEPVELPLVDGEEDGLVFLLVPGFDADEIQGIQYEVSSDEEILNVFCYESGYEEDEVCEGVAIPVLLNDKYRKLVQELSKLRLVDPLSITEDSVEEADYENIIDTAESTFNKTEIND